MIEKKVQFSSVEARKMIADYIDQSALRLSQRLKKAYKDQKSELAKDQSYA